MVSENCGPYYFLKHVTGFLSAKTKSLQYLYGNVDFMKILVVAKLLIPGGTRLESSLVLLKAKLIVALSRVPQPLVSEFMCATTQAVVRLNYLTAKQRQSPG